MAHSDDSRFFLELELLQAMYPDQIDFKLKGRELKFSDGTALLHLRIPETYPQAGLPEVISANNSAKQDLRDRVKQAIQEAAIVEGEEALDAVIPLFQSIVSDKTEDAAVADTAASDGSTDGHDHPSSKTIIIWLHHLLALTKRKLALAPTNPAVAGITKPGYPGVLLFTGPVDAVDEHVARLRAQNWQAFQVRYEGDKNWDLAHGEGVREVETMAEVVRAVEVGSNGAQRKEEFLAAVGIK